MLPANKIYRLIFIDKTLVLNIFCMCEGDHLIPFLIGENIGKNAYYYCLLEMNFGCLLIQDRLRVNRT